MAPEIVWAPQQGPQTALLTCPVEDILYGGARGGGKTDGTIGKAMQHHQLHGRHARILYLRRTFPQLREVMDRAQELLPAVGATWQAGNKEWRWPDGGFLRFAYLDREGDEQNYQGHSYTLIIIDEAGNFPSPAPLDFLRSCLRSAAGVLCQMIATANPGGPGHEWMRRRYMGDGRRPNEPWHDAEAKIWRVYIPSKLRDNPALAEGDPKYMDRLRSATVGRPWLLRAWLDGDWTASLEGELILREWLERLPRFDLDSLPRFERVILSLDTASKDKELNDWTVCQAWGVDSRGDVWLLDLVRQKVKMPALVRLAQSMAEKWQPTAMLIEDKSSGTGLIQLLEDSPRWQWSVIPVLPMADKVTRMAVETPWFQARRVHLPRSAPWLPEYEGELLGFPSGSKKDQVDATSQLLLYCRGGSQGATAALTSW